MRKAGTISPLIHTLEKKLKLGLYSPTSKSITKSEAIQVLTSHLLLMNPAMSSKTGYSNFRTMKRGHIINRRKKAEKVAKEIINNMYQRLKKQNPTPFRKAKVKTRRCRSAPKWTKSPSTMRARNRSRKTY
jgi:hypothetical protein